MICLDTHVLIWVIQGKARKGQERLVAKAKQFIRHLEIQGKRVMIPAPVVGEYLVPFDEKERPTQLDLITRLFFVPALDVHAAAVQAQLEGNKDLLREIKDAYGLDRQQIRVDAQILAVAIVNSAEKVVSYDPHMPRLAQGRIAVEELPDIHEQMNMQFPGS
jgi:predicted nucleic acid-binding protein